MTVVIVEDELPAQRLLKNMILKLRPQWTVLTTLSSVEESIAWLGSHPQPDLLFLDIQLSDGLSFEIFKQISLKCPVIFTTAYDEYAIQAFQVNSLDYLLKPIDEEKLEEAFIKLESLTAPQPSPFEQSVDFQDLMEALTQSTKRYRKRFLIATSSGYQKLLVEEIAYLYSLNKITFAVTFDGQEHVIDLSLDRLGEELNPDDFFRTNRQTLVNIRSVQKIAPFFQGKLVVEVLPPHPEQIIVSKEKAPSFKKWLNY